MGWGLSSWRKETPLPKPSYNGWGAPYHIAFERRELPDAGANQYAYTTLALPMETPIGPGVMPRASIQGTAPSMYQRAQGVTLTTVGNPGQLTGAIVAQPLLNIDGPENPLVGMQSDRPGSFMLPRGSA